MVAQVWSHAAAKHNKYFRTSFETAIINDPLWEAMAKGGSTLQLKDSEPCEVPRRSNKLLFGLPHPCHNQFQVPNVHHWAGQYSFDTFQKETSQLLLRLHVVASLDQLPVESVESPETFNDLSSAQANETHDAWDFFFFHHKLRNLFIYCSSLGSSYYPFNLCSDL